MLVPDPIRNQPRVTGLQYIMNQYAVPTLLLSCHMICVIATGNPFS